MLTHVLFEKRRGWMLIHETLDKAVKQTPDKKAVICAEESCTYAQLHDTMGLWAKTLLSLGIAKGDRVALFMKNGVDLVGLYYACFRIGAIAVPLNTRFQTPEAAYGLEQSGSRILITSAELYPVVENLDSTLSLLEHIYLVDGEPEQPSRSWKKATANVAETFGFPEVNGSDPAVIVYTSGSTGKPKGVVHTHDTFCHLIQNKTKAQEVDPDDSVLIPTQISHVAGLVATLLYLGNGATVVMMQKFEPGRYILILNQYKPTIVMLLPTQLLEVLEHPDAKDTDFSSVRHVLVGGDKVQRHVYELFRKKTGKDFMEGYGLTEWEGCLLQPWHGKIKPGSIGKPLPGVQIRLVDRNGNDVPQGKTGEILLRGNAVTIGYWNKPEETKKAFENGWFHTGDLAYRDEEDYYHFSGRIKELIIRGGSNIMPGEVEDVINEHPSVELCGVVGFPDRHYGNIVGAFVVPKQNLPAPTVEALTDFVSERLSHYKVPQKWIFVDTLPRNPVGKIDRKQLRDLAERCVST
jgi:acyl-CoA synthetase (AMP-forming)/AMP-acid ligase II